MAIMPHFGLLLSPFASKGYGYLKFRLNQSILQHGWKDPRDSSKAEKLLSVFFMDLGSGRVAML